MLDSSPFVGECLHLALFTANLTKYCNQLGSGWVEVCVCACKII